MSVNLREIDRLVAEKVMGWKADFRDDVYENSPRRWLVSGWRPSTDIAAAWEVVEKLSPGRPFVLQIRNTMMGGFQVRASWTDTEIVNTYDADFGGRMRVDQATAATAPLAICLAALRAAGVEVPA
jgi:hypothetical protein